LTDELEKLLRRDRTALAENPYVKNENALTAQERAAMQAPALDPEVQKHLTNFSLITHGFGGPAMVAVLNAFKHYLNSMRTSYEKCMGMPPNGVNDKSNSSSSSSSSSSMHLTGFNNSKNSNANLAYFNGLQSLKVESKD
jgi:hypothetical protein